MNAPTAPMNAPTALVLGAGGERVARRALRQAGGAAPALLVLWTQATTPSMAEQDSSAASAPSPAPARGEVRATKRWPWAAVRTREPAREALAAVLGGDGQLRRQGRLMIARVPRRAGSSTVVLDLLGAHAGAVAIVAFGTRDGEVDRIVGAVDEVIATVPGDATAYRAALERELRGVARRHTIVQPPQARWAARAGGDGGQATVALIAVLAGLMAVAVALGVVASALGRGAEVQGRADVAALAGAAALRDAQAELYAADPQQRITVAEVRRRALAAARRVATANALTVSRVGFAGSVSLPTRVEVVAVARGPRAGDRQRTVRARAEVAVGAGLPATENASGGGYSGPLAVRQGQRMRPDVALAFDRLNAAAIADGHPLMIVSAYRSDAEQARLFAAHPDPRWVAPPGQSLHRLGTELDLGPASAYGWLAANAERFGFKQRYSWEAWHYGYVRSAGSASVGYRATGAGERASGAMPSFVPARFAPMISAAAQRWSVGAALLAAQLWQESRFDPNAVSPVGAAGIAQFMPGTAASYGLTPAERFDPAKAIDAQGHLMHDLLRQFASVPLALAAYNAGPGNVQRCMCVPAIPETQGYVQSILALLGGAGVAAPAGLEIRLVASTRQ
ncbi:MAG: transglycosylase SLT domain-containing protein [Patulibacter sp.]